LFDCLLRTSKSERITYAGPDVDFIASLDGYAAGEGWPGFWGMEGSEYLAWLGGAPEREHTTLMGAGSLTLCRTLLSAGLVDRFRVVVFPVITGITGRQRIYDDPDVKLEMVKCRTFDGKLQLLEYVPTVFSDPPGSGPTHPR
jgi:hypothetical protein